MAGVCFILILVAFGPPALGAVKAEDCLECHEEYKEYVHGSPSCLQCHADIAELPHSDKLKKPSCVNCHKRIQDLFVMSIHSKKGASCKECHEVHFINKEKRYCSSCHVDNQHKALPFRKLHLARLRCVACHASVTDSEIEVYVAISGNSSVKKLVVDRDGNGLIDADEWNIVRTFLENGYKGRYTINKRFVVKADEHGVSGAPASCADCHIDRKTFGKARLKGIGSTAYGTPIDPKLFLQEVITTTSTDQRIRPAD
jgi:hypothetical protein